MDNFRNHGAPPFRIAVIHGGPGAAGSVGAVARELAHLSGTLEPLQTADTIPGQIEELKSIFESHGEAPFILVGHSWGAWLSALFAARHPALVKKLILVAAAPFEEHYAESIMPTRLSRLNEKERARLRHLQDVLSDPHQHNKNAALAEFGALMAKADSFDLLPHDPHQPKIKFQAKIHQKIWAEAAALRRCGELLRVIKTIQCPVVAIHGADDPHPAAGVQLPLSQSLPDFRFILLPECGHEPWKERRARARFFEILKEEI